MSLFVCEECRTVENTALSDFWNRKHREGDDHRALCSACGPEGVWHGRFDRRTYRGPGLDTVQWADGKWIDGRP